MLDGMAPGRVLDAPCGEGALARNLVQIGHEVWACDLDPTVLAPTAGIRFDVVALNGPLPYPDGFFDAIVSLEGIEHLEMPAVCLDNVQSRPDCFLTGRFSGFKTLARLAWDPRAGPVHWHVTTPYVSTIAFLLTRHGLRLDTVGGHDDQDQAVAASALRLLDGAQRTSRP